MIAVIRKNGLDWYSVGDAAKRISENSGREISRDYVTTLGKKGYIGTEEQDRRTKLYLKRDVDAYVVSTKRGPKPKQKEVSA